MAKATEGMSLQEEREYWRLLREGKVKLTWDILRLMEKNNPDIIEDFRAVEFMRAVRNQISRET
jgi:hypothetical protein